MRAAPPACRENGGQNPKGMNRTPAPGNHRMGFPIPMTTLGSTDDLADAIALARREAGGDPAAAFAEVQRLLFGSRGRLLLGRYRVAHRLGSGGQGTVWVAHD